MRRVESRRRLPDPPLPAPSYWLVRVRPAFVGQRVPGPFRGTRDEAERIAHAQATTFKPSQVMLLEVTEHHIAGYEEDRCPACKRLH